MSPPEHCGGEDRQYVRTAGEEGCEMLFSGHDLSTKFINSQQQLWLPPQDLHKMKLAEVLMQEL